MLDAIAQAVGYLVLGVIGTLVGVTIISHALSTQTDDSAVSDEARELAKAVNPNNPVERETAALLAENILQEVRELQPDETIQADPQPLVYFDWSDENARQEDIEHILSTLQDAGYHTHPFPEIEMYRERAMWGRKRAGVWRHEPDWRIVEYGDELGAKTVKETVDLPLPQQWQPETGESDG